MFQHGFTKGSSCLTNILEFYEAVSDWVDDGKAVDIVYCCGPGIGGENDRWVRKITSPPDSPEFKAVAPDNSVSRGSQNRPWSSISRSRGVGLFVSSQST